ncbi:MAG: CvpA family protein [Planctomycetes bacterium]|nr:CvpA family protein [Planctomycetota bacterium]
MLLTIFAILVGGAFAVIGIKQGLFVMWSTLFNISIAVYLGVMITPWIISMVAEDMVSYYHCAVCVLMVGIMVFTLLQVITSMCFTGTYDVSFPGFFENLAGGLAGFLSGYLVCAFLFFVICVAPFSHSDMLTGLFGERGFAKSGTPPVVAACNIVGAISLQGYKGIADEITDNLSYPGGSAQYDPHAMQAMPVDEEEVSPNFRGQEFD